MTLIWRDCGYHPEGIECPECGKIMEMHMRMSAAGYYLGYFCEFCGPYSRETGYYLSRADAQDDLDRIKRGEEPFNPRK